MKHQELAIIPLGCQQRTSVVHDGQVMADVQLANSLSARCCASAAAIWASAQAISSSVKAPCSASHSRIAARPSRMRISCSTVSAIHVDIGMPISLVNLCTYARTSSGRVIVIFFVATRSTILRYGEHGQLIHLVE